MAPYYEWKDRYKQGHGTITFPTPTALALWEKEILGQLSDGMWENSRPHDHWRYWSRLDSEVRAGICALTGSMGGPQKTCYNLSALIPFIGDRMLKIGQDIVGEENYGKKELKQDLKYIRQAMKSFDSR